MALREDREVSYVGIRGGAGAEFFVDVAEGDVVSRTPFDPRPSLKLWNHSPTGFEWGYGGSGPAQFALAILLDVLLRSAVEKRKAAETAVRLHQKFKWDHVANRDRDAFRISAAQVAAWLDDQEG